MKSEENFIPGIYNYCDRWCERCPFSSRCQNFQSQTVKGEHSQDFESEEFIGSIQDNLRDAVLLLEQAAEERGLDWSEIQEAAENFEAEDPDFTPEQSTLIKRSHKYYNLANNWLDSNEDLLKRKEAEIQKKDDLGIDVKQEVEELNEALDTIYHFLYFINTKISRAVESLHDEWMVAEYPIQNDANGTAKVTIIAIKESLVAWEIIRQQMPDAENDLLDILVALSRISKDMKREFPQAESFVRPGFDEMGGAVSEQ